MDVTHKFCKIGAFIVDNPASFDFSPNYMM
jgi:hypothetical protein